MHVAKDDSGSWYKVSFYGHLPDGAAPPQGSLLASLKLAGSFGFTHVDAVEVEEAPKHG